MDFPHLVVARVYEHCEPIDRGNRYEDPLQAVLERAKLGRVAGGAPSLLARADAVIDPVVFAARKNEVRKSLLERRPISVTEQGQRGIGGEKRRNRSQSNRRWIAAPLPFFWAFAESGATGFSGRICDVLGQTSV